MRTTVTLDPDVVAKLQATVRERGLSFKVVLNEALRAGLSGPAPEAGHYRFPSRSLGLRNGVDLDHALGLAADLEDSEVVRKLELRK